MARGDPWSSSISSSSMNVADRRRLMAAATSGRHISAPRRGGFQRKPGRAEVRQRARRRKLAAAPDPSRAGSLEPLEVSPCGQPSPLATRHGAAETVDEDITQTNFSEDSPVTTASAFLAGMPRSDTLWALGADEIAEDRTLEAALAQLRLERKQASAGAPSTISSAVGLHRPVMELEAGTEYTGTRSTGRGSHRTDRDVKQATPVRAERVLTQRERDSELNGWGTPQNFPPKTRTPDDIAAAVKGPPPPEAEHSPPQATLELEAPAPAEEGKQQKPKPTQKQKQKQKQKLKPKLGPKTPNDADRASFLDAPEWEILSTVRGPGNESRSGTASIPPEEDEGGSRPSTSVLKAAEAAAMKALGKTCRARQFEAVMAVEEEQKDDQTLEGGTVNDNGQDSDSVISDDSDSKEAGADEDGSGDELSARLMSLSDDDSGPLFGQATLKTWGRSKVRERVKARAAQPRAQPLSRKTASVAAKYQKHHQVIPRLPPGRISEDYAEEQESMSSSPTGSSPPSLEQQQQTAEAIYQNVSATGNPIGPSAEAAAQSTPYRTPVGSRPYRRRRQPVGGESRTAVRRIESTVVQ